MATWEYKIEEFDSGVSQWQLEELGKAGWELMHVITNPMCPWSLKMVFKRPETVLESLQAANDFDSEPFGVQHN